MENINKYKHYKVDMDKHNTCQCDKKYQWHVHYEKCPTLIWARKNKATKEDEYVKLYTQLSIDPNNRNTPFYCDQCGAQLTARGIALTRQQQFLVELEFRFKILKESIEDALVAYYFDAECITVVPDDDVIERGIAAVYAAIIGNISNPWDALNICGSDRLFKKTEQPNNE